jgi:hypothetical protein
VTAVEARVTHEWRLVAPWWYWPKAAGAGPDDRRSVRSSAPALQKYDTPDLVNTFLADPQRRLEFDEDSDRVAQVILSGPALGGFPEVERGGRKLYLGSHHRQYLVVCSLHCDVPGFPEVARAGVCQAGLVVRRRTTDLPPDAPSQTVRALRRYAAARRRREGVEAQIAAARQGGRAGTLRLGMLDARLRSLLQAEGDARAEVRAWAEQAGARRTLEGWVGVGVGPAGTGTGTVTGPLPACPGQPTALTPLAGTGAWQPVDELPEQLAEARFPLYPLVPDPTNPDHDAAGETLYFGVVPTGSADVDLAGNARFDDRSSYEIRCFVRRHRAECPLDGDHCRCPITWSAPTESYQLASHYDLEGTANRPTTVQLPDLAQLHADTLRLGPGNTGGVRFQSPPGSGLPFTSKNTEATSQTPATVPEICSFAIPLITIVAMFVLRLFLPIVVFVFQLWFLLLLRFCIPRPSVTVGSGLAGVLERLGTGLDIDPAEAVRLTVAPFDTQAAKALDDLGLKGFQDADGKKLTERLMEAVRAKKVEPRSFAAVVKGALATTPTDPRLPVFAARVERDQVVVP